ncbi:hypothetical protein P0F65_09185 [Sphingomonas sp. I4]
MGLAFAQLTGGPVALAMAGTAIVLAVFAMLFGTRRYEAAGRNEGLVFATAFEIAGEADGLASPGRGGAVVACDRARRR